MVCGRRKSDHSDRRISFLESRPSSIIGTPRLLSILSPSTSGTQVICSKPFVPNNSPMLCSGSCQKGTYFPDEASLSTAPTNLALQNVLERYLAQHPSQNPDPPKEPTSPPTCQLCENGIQPATVVCEQCEIFYCNSCLSALHPARGPLAKHSIVPASHRYIFSNIFMCVFQARRKQAKEGGEVSYPSSGDVIHVLCPLQVAGVLPLPARCSPLGSRRSIADNHMQVS